MPQGLIRLEDVLAHTQLEGSISPTGFDATLRQARAKFEARGMGNSPSRLVSEGDLRGHL